MWLLVLPADNAAAQNRQQKEQSTTRFCLASFRITAPKKVYEAGSSSTIIPAAPMTVVNIHSWSLSFNGSHIEGTTMNGNIGWEDVYSQLIGNNAAPLPALELDPSSGLSPTQYPTLPLLYDQSPTPSPGASNPVIPPLQPVNSTFSPGANINALPPDVILLCSDGVDFYVHSHVLLEKSTNNFAYLLPSSPYAYAPPQRRLSDSMSSNIAALSLAESGAQPSLPILNLSLASSVLNIILHGVYGLLYTSALPSIDTLVSALEEMPALGFLVKTLVSPDSTLHNLILSLAPQYPMQLYALAAQFDLLDLARPISSHLLSISLPQIEDSVLQRMGPIYLKKLVALHLDRTESLRQILLQRPQLHPPVPSCGLDEQKVMSRTWSMASAALAWSSKPDITADFLNMAFKPLIEPLKCGMCKGTLYIHLKSVINQWAEVKTQIL